VPAGPSDRNALPRSPRWILRLAVRHERPPPCAWVPLGSHSTMIVSSFLVGVEG
jgi:hypothetical protein